MVRRKEEEKILDVTAAMQGNLTFSDAVNLRINGRFEGSLSTKGKLTVGNDAEVMADISGEDITISGTIKGRIKATEALRFTATAQVTGDIETPKLSIEEGAVFKGKCKMFEDKISLEELSDYLSIEKNKIMEWVDDGKIPTEREGPRLLFNRKQVEDWLAQRAA